MQIIHLHVFGVHCEGVLTVDFGLEVDGHFALGFGTHDGVFLIALRDVDVGVLLHEIEFAKLAALVEAHDGVVQSLHVFAATGGHCLGEGHLEVAVVDSIFIECGFAEGDGFVFGAFSFNNDTCAWSDCIGL